jgi:hypothetical protein
MHLYLLTGLLLTSLAHPALPFQRQGIEGRVFLVGGNRMPSPKTPRNPPQGIRAVVDIYELTDINQVTRLGQSGYYQAVHTRLIREVNTDDSGRFRVLLPPGSYSIFTRKGELFYATRMDEKNHIAPVEVLPGKMTEVECRVESDHKSVY